LNVMCCFSPDDRNILCSGVDQALQQFNLRGRADDGGSRFPLPALRSDTNYRRSLYFGGGDLVATAATNESLMRIYTAQAPHLHCGQIDFRGMLYKRRHSTRQFVNSLLRLDRGDSGHSGRSGEVAVSTPAQTQQDASPIVETAVAPGGREPTGEYIQSLRCHPADKYLLGALLATSDSQPESFIALMRLGSG